MDPAWQSETITKRLCVVANKCYDITLPNKIQEVTAKIIPRMLTYIFFVLRWCINENFALNPRHTLVNMLLASILLIILGYFGSLWINSPMLPHDRVQFEVIPIIESVCLAARTLYKRLVSPYTRAQKEKLLILWGYYVAFVLFFCKRWRKLNRNLEATMDKANQLNWVTRWVWLLHR